MNYRRISLVYLRWILVIFVIAFGIIVAMASGGGSGGSSDSDDDDDEQEQVTSPQFLLAEGRYYNEQTITITCATEGATISYTTDNTDPSETEGTTITSGGSFELSTTGTVKAIAYRTGMLASEITSAEYIFPLWTWVSGDATIDQSGVYGTKGEGDAANKPGSRDSSISWIDLSGNLWLFGGSGYDDSEFKDS